MCSFVFGIWIHLPNIKTCSGACNVIAVWKVLYICHSLLSLSNQCPLNGPKRWVSAINMVLILLGEWGDSGQSHCKIKSGWEEGWSISWHCFTINKIWTTPYLSANLLIRDHYVDVWGLVSGCGPTLIWTTTTIINY